MLMNRLSISIIRSSKRILKSNFVQPRNSNSVSLTTNFIGYHATTGRRFTCQQFSTSTTTPNDSEEQLALDKKRILWASIKRGMRENELILGRFARANLKSMSRKELGKKSKPKKPTISRKNKNFHTISNRMIYFLKIHNIHIYFNIFVLQKNSFRKRFAFKTFFSLFCFFIKDQFAHILQQHDQFLNNWLLKKEPIPDELNTEVFFFLFCFVFDKNILFFQLYSHKNNTKMWKRIVAFIEAGPDNLELHEN